MYERNTAMLSRDLYRQYKDRAPEVAWARFTSANDYETRSRWYAVHESMALFSEQAVLPKVMDNSRSAMLDMARLLMRS
jgi:hypothetical protein